MNALKTFGRFWYDFIVGDDWRLALGGVLAIGVMTFAAGHDVNVWWLLPLCVSALLWVSLLHATRRSSP